jgi:hypothetical protein
MSKEKSMSKSKSPRSKKSESGDSSGFHTDEDFSQKSGKSKSGAADKKTNKDEIDTAKS